MGKELGLRQPRTWHFIYVAAAAVFCVATIYLLARAFAGADLIEVVDTADPALDTVQNRQELWPWLLVAFASGAIAFGGWWRERRRAAAAGPEHQGFTRLKHARDVEREWTRRLREEVAEMQRTGGALGDPNDVRGLVLRIAVALLGAEKGLLLARHDSDGDGDGDLELVAYEGFTHNPEHSGIAQRFAGKVIKRDRTIREDEPKALDPDRQGKADDEIRNLVAIPIYIRDEFRGVVVCANKEGGFQEHDDEVLLALGDHAGAILENSNLHGALRLSYIATVRMLAEAIEVKDPFLRGHSEEVSDYVASVAGRLELEPRRREELAFGSLLHDVGKIGISERILLKPGSLTQEELSIVRLHPRIGFRLVREVPSLAPIARAILHHHERFDGSGYPAGLKGEDIPLEARVICVADSFSAMTSERPYRRRVSLDAACAELERCAGTQFDPRIVELFVEEVRRDPAKADRSGISDALRDPELDLLRDPDEPLLGYGSHALTDNLTLLYSHRYLHEAADSEAERSAVQKQPFAVLLVEPADIARTNQERGYAAGDQAIKNVARAIQHAAVRCGGTACRYSGPRIALICPETEEGGVEELARQMAIELEGEVEIKTAAAVWRPGEEASDVIARARRGLTVPASTYSN